MGELVAQNLLKGLIVRSYKYDIDFLCIIDGSEVFTKYTRMHSSPQYFVKFSAQQGLGNGMKVAVA